MFSQSIKSVELAIIESLETDDKKTGKELYDSIIKWKTYQKQDVRSSYYYIASRNDFFETMESIKTKAIKENVFFVLHFEMHGNETGFCLENSECVNWSEVVPYLEEINLHYQNALMICLAICKGAFIITCVNPLKTAPFRIIISSEKNLWDSDLEKGFQAFYDSFLWELDPYEAAKSYNSVIQKKEDEIVVMDIEHIFEEITDFKSEPIPSNPDKIALIKQAKANRNRFLVKGPFC